MKTNIHHNHSNTSVSEDSNWIDDVIQKHKRRKYYYYYYYDI